MTDSKLILMICIFCYLSPAYSNDYELSFNKASSLHKGEFESLMRKRGLPTPQERAATFDNIDKMMMENDDSTLIFYHHDNDYLKIWALNSEGVAWDEVHITKQDLMDKVSGYRTKIGSVGQQLDRLAKPRGKMIYSPKTYKSVSAEEISHLFFPENIETLAKTKNKILIVPSLNIGSVPFSSLAFPISKTPLSETVSITLLPSLFDVDSSAHAPRRNKNLHALVVGNPTFGIDKDWSFSQLPGAEREARSISKLFDSDLYLGKDATKENIISKISSVDIVYFATHGISSDTSPLDESFLALSDGQRLTAKEIQNLTIHAELVVLSACQTGLGASEDAGIIGLARAFKIAGAREVVVSLWNIDDSVTEALMSTFMKHYSENPSIDASSSLRISMAEIKEKYPEPVYWAPFVVINGKGSISE